MAEVVMELAAMLGSFAPSLCVKMKLCTSTAKHSAPATIAAVTLVVAGLFMAVAMVQSSLALSIALNSAAFGACAALYAFACTAIAESLEDPRYAVLFSANTMLSLGVSSIIVAGGSSAGLSTNAYFVVGAVQEWSLAFLTLTWWGVSAVGEHIDVT